jgi:hypothetical protein
MQGEIQSVIAGLVREHKTLLSLIGYGVRRECASRRDVKGIWEKGGNGIKG